MINFKVTINLDTSFVHLCCTTGPYQQCDDNHYVFSGITFLFLTYAGGAEGPSSAGEWRMWLIVTMKVELHLTYGPKNKHFLCYLKFSMYHTFM